MLPSQRSQKPILSSQKFSKERSDPEQSVVHDKLSNFTFAIKSKHGARPKRTKQLMLREKAQTGDYIIKLNKENEKHDEADEEDEMSLLSFQCLRETEVEENQGISSVKKENDQVDSDRIVVMNLGFTEILTKRSHSNVFHTSWSLPSSPKTYKRIKFFGKRPSYED